MSSPRSLRLLAVAPRPIASDSRPLAVALRPIARASRLLAVVLRPIAPDSRLLAIAPRPIAPASRLLAVVLRPIASDSRLLAIAPRPIAPASRLLAVALRPVARASRLLAVAALLAAGCSSTYERRDWSGYRGPGARYFQAEELEFPHVDDPLEPANRISAGVNLALMRYALAPAAAIYRHFVPQGLRKHVAQAGVNLQYPVRLANNLLQLKWSEAGDETARFVINSTLGLLGLYDPASRMGIPAHPEDFGQTFAHWGWRDSVYLHLPIVGPSTARDALGLVPEWYVDPTNVDWRWASAREFNEHADTVAPALRAIEAAYDPYEPARTLYALQREVDVRGFTWERDESGPTQSLESIFLKPKDPHFAEIATTQRAPLEDGRSLPYTLWLRPGSAPLVYVVPGLGGHRVGDGTLGLAEIAYRDGCSVVAVSNPTNWEFAANAASVPLPGYAPVDARDLHAAIVAIDRRLETLHPGRFEGRRLAGLSMGAFHVLAIAASESPIPFEVYLAIDPPVSLEHAMHVLDSFYNAPLAYLPEERERRIEEIFAKVLHLSRGDLWPGMELPFTQIESEYLIGLAFRMELQFTILQSQERRDMGVLRTKRSALRRAPAYREASEYSFLEYMYAFVLPDYASRDPRITFDEAGARTMFDDCDLRSVADALRTNDRVLVFANENDFLLRPDDVAWLRDTLGDRAHVFPAGGHLGNLHRKGIQEAIRISVERKVEESGPAD